MILFAATLIHLFASPSSAYEVPAALVEPLSPSGFRVSIPDAPGIQLFAFHGSINKELNDLEAGAYSQDILRRTEGRWVFEDRLATLKPGDKLYYWTFVIVDGLGYRKDAQEYTLPSSSDPSASSTSSPESTSPSLTASLTDEVECLRNDVKLLTTVVTEMLDEQPRPKSIEDRRLVILSKAPATGNEVQNVQTFFNETLGIDADVDDAWTSSQAGGIVVIMKNRSDKLRVLMSACLRMVRNLISNPTGFIPRNADLPDIDVRMFN